MYARMFSINMVARSSYAVTVSVYFGACFVLYSRVHLIIFIKALSPTDILETFLDDVASCSLEA